LCKILAEITIWQMEDVLAVLWFYCSTFFP